VLNLLASASSLCLPIAASCDRCCVAFLFYSSSDPWGNVILTMLLLSTASLTKRWAARRSQLPLLWIRTTFLPVAFVPSFSRETFFFTVPLVLYMFLFSGPDQSPPFFAVVQLPPLLLSRRPPSLCWSLYPGLSPPLWDKLFVVRFELNRAHPLSLSSRRSPF